MSQLIIVFELTQINHKATACQELLYPSEEASIQLARWQERMGATYCRPGCLKSMKCVSYRGDSQQRQERGKSGSIQVALLGGVPSTLNPTLWELKLGPFARLGFPNWLSLVTAKIPACPLKQDSPPEWETRSMAPAQNRCLTGKLRGSRLPHAEPLRALL